jgi:predicted secreted protein
MFIDETMLKIIARSAHAGKDGTVTLVNLYSQMLLESVVSIGLTYLTKGKDVETPEELMKSIEQFIKSKEPDPQFQEKMREEYDRINYEFLRTYIKAKLGEIKAELNNIKNSEKRELPHKKNLNLLPSKSKELEIQKQKINNSFLEILDSKKQR